MIAGTLTLTNNSDVVAGDGAALNFEVEMPDGSKVTDIKSVDTYDIAAAIYHEAILALMDEIQGLKVEIRNLKAGGEASAKNR